jgi:copper resistance protein B
MSMRLRCRCSGGLVLGFLLACAPCAWAQEHDEHQAHEHATHGAGPIDPETSAADASEGDPARARAEHVPPPPPQHAMGDMSAAQMIEVMEMDDAATLAMLKLDRFERAATDSGPATAWKADAWIGGDFEKILLRSEGEHADGEFEHADAELLWSHAIAAFWDTELGLRRDFGSGTHRSWAAFGVQGLAPYWFEVGATAYIGDAGRTALRVEVDYEMSLTQRLILQPRLEFNAYGKDDPAAGIGSGLSDAEFGLRLRYEIRREFAPYVGVEWSRSFGDSADFARAGGRDAGDTRFVVGLRIWY